jgi:hypothetical protein
MWQAFLDRFLQFDVFSWLFGVPFILAGFAIAMNSFKLAKVCFAVSAGLVVFRAAVSAISVGKSPTMIAIDLFTIAITLAVLYALCRWVDYRALHIPGVTFPQSSKRLQVKST